jgi:hypothetical protein
VILRLATLILLALTLPAGAFGPPAFAQTPVPPVEIDVEGFAVLLAPADADAFQRRLNQPPRLNDPAASGPSYTVTTAYWDAAVREEDTEPVVETAAEYFPGGGFVRARQDGQDVWLVLDPRQRVILDRYITYYAGHPRPQLEPRVGSLSIAVATTPHEAISIEAGDRRLSPDETVPFWEALNGRLQAEFSDPPRPPGDGPGYWITFTFPEGRALLYFNDTAAATLTDALGTESYDIAGAGDHRIPPSAGVGLIEDDDRAGSWVWWPVAVGGGGGLLVIAAWLHLRLRRSEGL